MIAEDQSATIDFLKQPASHRIAEAVDTIETHISMVFLAGERVFKLKRAVKLPYADFSTPLLRLRACEKEVALNRTTAPGLYIGLRLITRTAAGGLALDGEGEVVDAVVEMVRFPQEMLLDRVAAEGRLTPALMTEVAQAIARFHRAAPVVHAASGASNLCAVLDVNKAGFATSQVFSPVEVNTLDAALRSALAGNAARLNGREARGTVRRCHGDLHLRNICLFEGQPQLFDCLEFNDALATTDTLYDLAFLLMDLWHRGLVEFANLVANRYLDAMDDEDGFTLLPFFMAVRAAVRAHVTATQEEEGSEPCSELLSVARSYFQLARVLPAPLSPRLVAIGGFSGSGKTTVAGALAPRLGGPPGARILESDRVRKVLFGVPADAKLGPDAYRAEVSMRVYSDFACRAGLVVSGGGAVIVEAVFDDPGRRHLLERTARGLGVPFSGIWLDAGADVLRERVGARQNGPSDATVDVLEGQLARASGEVGWMRIDATRPLAEIVGTILGLHAGAQEGQARPGALGGQL